MQKFRVTTTLILFLAAAPWAFAQTVSGSITGTVTDSSGGAITNATATLLNNATAESRSMKTSTGGDFVFNAVAPGTYSLKINKPGSRPWIGQVSC